MEILYLETMAQLKALMAKIKKELKNKRANTELDTSLIYQTM